MCNLQHPSHNRRYYEELHRIDRRNIQAKIHATHSFRHRNYMNSTDLNTSGNYATATKTLVSDGLSSAEQNRTATSRRDATFA